jgi:L-threonylcarbamoyladenylate synthase
VATPAPVDPALVAVAAGILRRGGLVAFPTETVYGLGADATSTTALEHLFVVKGRPRKHPLILHLGDASWLGRWTRDVPPAALRLAAAFWPGPLTMILRRSPLVPDAVTGGQDTVGVRVPRHPVARALLDAFDGPIAAPSANRFGRVSPTTAAHVVADLGGDVVMVLDGGPCDVGIESTIVDLAHDAPVVLRPGAITAEEIERVAGVPVARTGATSTTRAPGTLDAHYAPRTPMFVFAGKEFAAQVSPGRIAVLAFRPPRWARATDVVHSMPRDAERYAHELYAALRDLDLLGAERIVVEQPPDEPAWAGVNDRLRRASRGSGG